MSKNVRTLMVGMGALLTVCLVLGPAILAYPALYHDRIYPDVSAQGVELGGLSVQEATSRLRDRHSSSSPHGLTLAEGERSWHLDGADLGRRYDWARTAEQAYQAGRRGPWLERALAAWDIRLHGVQVEPRLDPPDPTQVEDHLSSIAREIHVPPTEASVSIDAAGVACARGESGKALDVQVTTEKVVSALDQGLSKVELATVVLEPDIRDPEPACSRARALLSQPLSVVVDDPLTNYHAVFEAAPERMSGWLSPAPAGDGVGLDVDEAVVEAWLQAIAPQIGSERILDVDETLERTMTALSQEEHQVRSAIRHPQHTYVVEPGDTLFDIAYDHGFPQWRLEEANPDVGPDELLIGMELTIPSIDVLFPESLAPGKRIEIDLPEQTLRAYEDDELVYEVTCSSGMTSTPTIAGQFQVLFKEPNAYAQRWNLEMPYFMAIYYEGPDFANGIHELPIRSNGQRLWSSVLGWPASYGCIILNVGDAKKLYDWVPVGTLVRIEGVAPGTPIYVPTYDDEGPQG